MGPSDRPRVSRDNSRRVVLLTALGWAGMGGALATWPLIAQMNPNPGTPRPDAVEVDLVGIEPGQTIEVRRSGISIVLVRHRTVVEIERARARSVASLVDRVARNDALPPEALAVDANRVVSGMERWLVVKGACTRGDCLLRPQSDTEGTAFFCPCCAARYDTSGRVLSGPAPRNLAVPRVTFVSPTRMRLG